MTCPVMFFTTYRSATAPAAAVARRRVRCARSLFSFVALLSGEQQLLLSIPPRLLTGWRRKETTEGRRSISRESAATVTTTPVTTRVVGCYAARESRGGKRERDVCREKKNRKKKNRSPIRFQRDVRPPRPRPTRRDRVVISSGRATGRRRSSQLLLLIRNAHQSPRRRPLRCTSGPVGGAAVRGRGFKKKSTAPPRLFRGRDIISFITEQYNIESPTSSNALR